MGERPNTMCAIREEHTLNMKTPRLYLLLGPKLIKHLLDLQFPVILQRVEGLRWHLKKARLFDGRQLVQN